MKAKDLKVGSIVKTTIGDSIWTEHIINRVSEKYVWFNGSGYSRIARTTFENYPTLYHIVKI